MPLDDVEKIVRETLHIGLEDFDLLVKEVVSHDAWNSRQKPDSSCDEGSTVVGKYR